MSEGHFECKVERRSENAKGIFLTLLINPADHDEALSQVRVGAAMQVGWAEIVDASVQPIEFPQSGGGERTSSHQGEKGAASDPAPVAAPRSKRAFSELDLVTQCGIRCGDAQFAMFVAEVYPERFGRSRGDIAAFVRSYCEVKSRADLATDSVAAAKWKTLDRRFEAWQVSRQYQESVR